MRGKQRWVYLITMMCMFVMGVNSAYGIQEGNTDVMYMPGNIFHNLHVIVIGNGYVQDGSTQIRNGTNVYQLKTNEQKTFEVKADNDSHLKIVLLDGNEYQLNNNSLHINMKEQDAILIITFEKTVHDEVEDIPIFVPEKPILPPQEDEIKEKVIISVVTKTIPLEELKDGISDELIRSFIHSTADYKILSHNIKAKPGIYDVVIQFDDGTIRTVQIEVVDNEEEKGRLVEEEQCYIHWFILIVGIMYTGYMSFKVFNNNRNIKEINNRINCLESWDENNEKE